MNRQDFDRAVESVRQTRPDPETVAGAAERVRQRLETASTASEAARQRTVCAGFRADFAAYREGTLGEARRMLVEDHLHSCVACRNEYERGSGTGVVVPMQPRETAPAQVRKRRHWGAWAAAAAVLIAAGITAPRVLDRALAPAGPRATVASVTGSLWLVADQQTTPLAVGAEIGEGEEVRTGKDSHAVIRLRDGSMVEMADRSDLSIRELWRGKTIHLERGNLMIEAAKQRRGRLQVATADALVSVKGTIFGVSRGLKGSRVSVVQGEVQVDQGGHTELLYRGDQIATHESMARTEVVSDVAWSENAARYLALLADLQSVQRGLRAIVLPGLRYDSALLNRVPEGSVAVASLPNLTTTLDQATNVFEEQARDSEVLAEWWNGEKAQEMRKAIELVRSINQYLGEEVLISVPAEGQPVVIAEVRAGSQAQLEDYWAQAGIPVPLGFDGSVVAMGATAVPAPGGFPATPFGEAILERYQDGVSLLFAANLEQIIDSGVEASVDAQAETDDAGLVGVDNLRFLIAESKTQLGAPQDSVSLVFAGERHGIANWLAEPGPIGSLEFVSPEASFAASFVTRDPRELLEELLNAAGSDVGEVLDRVRDEAGVSIVDDIAGTLGGEATVAIDGTLLPVPSWKAIVEVDQPERLQGAIEQLVAAVEREAPDAGITLSAETAGDRVYHRLVLPEVPVPVYYTFTDGYWLMGASQALVSAAIETRASALSLPRSTAFRDQLPLNGLVDFSGLFYYNLGVSAGPLVDQLRESGLLPAEQQQQLDTLVANREPGLVYVYGEPDQIRVGSRGGFMQLGLQAIAGMASADPSFPLPPIFGFQSPQ